MTVKIFNIYMDYNEHKTKRNLLSSFKSQKEFIDFVNQFQPIGAKNFKDAMRENLLDCRMSGNNEQDMFQDILETIKRHHNNF